MENQDLLLLKDEINEKLKEAQETFAYIKECL